MKECKFDKYGCANEWCEKHYPMISRKSIIAEYEGAEETRKAMEEMNCWQNVSHVKSCQKCQEELGL